ncbi:MAG TPA: hypothetical protein VNX21_07145 [Candidatus Thermoplasmatota archaeon]|nr:hypothetical protein [Candidatus Thermoplasmatota archaeon]
MAAPDGLAKATRVTAALAGAAVLLWVGFCGPLASTFDPDTGSYGPTGFFGEVGVLFFVAALVLVPLALLLALAWAVRAVARALR